MTPKEQKDEQAIVKKLGTELVPIEKKLITKPRTAEEVVSARAQQTDLWAMAKTVKAKKEEITVPLNTALKKVRELFKPIETRIDDAITAIKSGLDDYLAREQAKLDTKAEQLAEKVESGEITESQAASRLLRAENKTSVGLIPTQIRKELVIEDEKKIPKKYWQLDLVLLRKDLLAGVEVPGAKIEEKEYAING